jgi:hypothetical protein
MSNIKTRHIGNLMRRAAGRNRTASATIKRQSEP